MSKNLIFESQKRFLTWVVASKQHANIEKSTSYDVISSVYPNVELPIEDTVDRIRAMVSKTVREKHNDRV